MLRTKITVILMGLFLAACSESARDFSEMKASPQSTGIVGGEEVKADDPIAASVVMIYGEREAGDAFICTGTFIAENVVLTAAHCVVESAEAMTLMFGNQPFAKTPETRSVKAVKKHEGYKGGGTTEDRNDLALIYFDGALPQGAKIAPMIVSSEINDPPVLLSYGYGRTEGREDSEDASSQLGILRKISSDASLFSAFNKELFVMDQSAGKGVCFGDSGGPLFSAKGEVVAVASGVAGSEGGTDACDSRSFFTNVLSYRDWIIKNLNPL